MQKSLLKMLLVCIIAMPACKASTSPSPSSNSGVTSLQITDIKVGTGAQAVAGKFVTVNYTGWVYSLSAADHHGSQFDTSIGKQPFTLTLGAGQVIQGWDQGVVGMRVGGQRTLIIPPSLG